MSKTVNQIASNIIADNVTNVVAMQRIAPDLYK